MANRNDMRRQFIRRGIIRPKNPARTRNSRRGGLKSLVAGLGLIGAIARDSKSRRPRRKMR